MNAVAIPQAVKRWLGRCMVAAPLVILFTWCAYTGGLLVALSGWGAAIALIGMFIVGMKWGFDE